MDLAADSRRIDLWCTYISEIGDDSLWPRYDALLSEDERDRRRRFRFGRDRRRYLVTRALARTVLSRYAQVRSEDWVFSPGPRGRPAIGAPRLEAALEFNIAHSADVVLLGVTTGRALGVDIESLEAREASTDGLERYFAPEESAALLALPPGARRRRFLELWTLKESYMKARGMGLAIPLDAFRFELRGERGLALHIRPGLGDSADGWRLWQLALRAGYLAAVCAARRVGEPIPQASARGETSGPGRQPPADDVPQIVVREIVPLEREQIVVVTPSRDTG